MFLELIGIGLILAAIYSLLAQGVFGERRGGVAEKPPVADRNLRTNAFERRADRPPDERDEN